MSEDLRSSIEAVVVPEKAGHLEIKDRTSDALIARAELMRSNQYGKKELVINKFEIAPEYENMGFGKMLMDSIKEILRKEKRIGVLSVHASNQNALGFYESQGWHIDDSVEDMLPKSKHKADDLQWWMRYETPDEEG